MSKDKERAGRLKKKVLNLLTLKDFEKGLAKIGRLPARQAINPLFSLLYSSDETVKWRAVTAIGVVVSGLADAEIESARVIMRRLLWNLNDESGGIGWGSPEAMGEIMARHHLLAQEYSSILVSFIRKDGNFIEHEVLQRGVLWGIGRLAHVRPQMVKSSIPFLLPFLDSEDATLRGLAAWTAGALDVELAEPIRRRLSGDRTLIKVFLDGRIVECPVNRLGKAALF